MYVIRPLWALDGGEILKSIIECTREAPGHLDYRAYWREYMNRIRGKKALGFVMVLIICMLTFGACSVLGNQSESSSEVSEASQAPEVKKIYKIGVIQFDDNSEESALREAFMKRLDEWGYDETQISIEYKNADGKADKLKETCTKMVQEETDMIVAISNEAAKQAVEAVKGTEVKVVLAGVNNPADFGITNPGTPEGNITGTAYNISGTSVAELALTLDPSIKTMGILYNDEDSYSKARADEIKKLFEEKELAVSDGTIKTDTDSVTVAAGLAENTDALIVLGDNAAVRSMKVAVEAMGAKGKAVYAMYSLAISEGALAAVSVDLTEVGMETADMAVELLEGKAVKEVPVKSFTGYKSYINQTAAETFSVKIPDELKTELIYIK